MKNIHYRLKALQSEPPSRKPVESFWLRCTGSAL